MKNVVVKLGVFLVTTALARAAATEGERSTGHVLDPKENYIHNADFSEMSEEVMDLDNWNLTSYQNIGARNYGFCDLEGYNPCDSYPKIYHKHPSKCEYFIQCSYYIPYCLKCPVNQHWSESINNCIRKENSDCTECECGEANIRRIIGGDVVSPERKYPWMVGLQIPAQPGQPRINYICGGSIINDRWIITAAHCVVNITNPCNKLVSFAFSLEVVVGDHSQGFTIDDVQGITKTFGITNIVPHCDYHCFTNEFDVALIELDNAIVFDDIIRPICLPKDDTDDYVGQTGIAIGWGRTNNPPSTPASVATDLKEVDLTIRANDDCGLYRTDSTYCSNKGSTPILSSAKLCAGSSPGEAVCRGDSGGPLFVFDKNINKHVLVGINSFGGTNCLEPNTPGVFTRVSKVLKWINSCTKNAKKCN